MNCKYCDAEIANASGDPEGDPFWYHATSGRVHCAQIGGFRAVPADAEVIPLRPVNEYDAFRHDMEMAYAHITSARERLEKAYAATGKMPAWGSCQPNVQVVYHLLGEIVSR